MPISKMKTLLSDKNAWNNAICSNVERPRDYHSKWSKLEKDKYDNSYTRGPHWLQHARLLCPSPTPSVYSNSGPLSRWCHPTISCSVVPFSSCLQSFRASGFFQISQFFTSGGQNIAVSTSASVLPMSIHDWSPLGWTGWNSLQS